MPNSPEFKADLAVLLQRHFPQLRGAGRQRLTIDLQVDDHSADIGNAEFMALPPAPKPGAGHFGATAEPLTGRKFGGDS